MAPGRRLGITWAVPRVGDCATPSGPALVASVVDPIHIAINRHPQLRSLTHYLSVKVNAWTMIQRVVPNALKGNIVLNPERS